jgi:hypothetical protein
MKTKLDPREDARFLELFERYCAVDEMEVQEDEAFHEYKLLRISHEKYNDYLLAFEMDNAGFELTECCPALDFMIFKSEKKIKAVILKWDTTMYAFLFMVIRMKWMRLNIVRGAEQNCQLE